MSHQVPRRRKSDSPFVRYMPLVGYIILTIAVAYAIYQTDRLHDRDLEQQKQQHIEGQEATRRAVYIGCAQRNNTKEAVEGILRDFRARAEAAGQDTKIYDDGIKDLRPDDCDALAKTIEP